MEKRKSGDVGLASGEGTVKKARVDGGNSTSNSAASPCPSPRGSPDRPSAAVWSDGGEGLRLDAVRDELIRQEETIIFALIERAQFARNRKVYAVGKKSIAPVIREPQRGVAGPQDTGPDNGTERESFLNFFLRRTEELHASLGRFTSPDENPFLVSRNTVPLIPSHNYPSNIRPNTININSKIKSIYESLILPRICTVEDDGQYGSAASCDIAVLQALSKRVHFGKFVAEAKFCAETAKYSELIFARDSEGLMRELTKPEVEARVVERVILKAGTYGRDPTVSLGPGKQESQGSPKIQPEEVGALYKDHVMPLNKDVQVSYLLQRLGGSVVSHMWPQSINEKLPALSSRILQLLGCGNGDPQTHTSTRNIRECIACVKCNGVTHAVVHVAIGGLSEGGCSSISGTTSKEEGIDLGQLPLPARIEDVHRELLTSGLVISAEAYISGSRFWRISKVYGGRTGVDRTTISFGLNDEPGQLSKVLSLFAKHDVNLLFITSTFIQPHEHRGPHFYVELEGYAHDANIAATMEEVLECVVYLQILGSYSRVGDF